MGVMMSCRDIITSLLCGALVVCATPAKTQQVDPRVADLTAAGKIRMGVFPSFQYSKDSATGQPRGLAIGITRAVAARLGISEVVTVEFPTPPQVVNCVKTGGCDFGFMLIDPARAAEVDFSPAFVRSDFTYLVPAGSAIRSAADADRQGIRVAAVRGHASTLALARIVKHATPVYAETYEGALDLMRTRGADTFASIREILLQHAPQMPGSRVLEDSYQTNFAGVAVPKGNPGRLAYVSEFLDEMKQSGLLQKLIDGAGLRGIDVVLAKPGN
jgi:polar amino acid transport system substrate-binding protein